MFRGLKKVSRYQSKDVNETILQKKWPGHVLPKTKRSELKGILRGNFCSCILCGILPLLDVASGPQTFWRYAEFVLLVASALAWALSPIRHVHSSLSHHQMEGSRFLAKNTTRIIKNP